MHKASTRPYESGQEPSADHTERAAGCSAETDRFQRQIAALESVLHRKSVDMTVAGHDLRQPLQILVGAIERIAPACQDPRDQFWIAAARDAGQRLARGLTDLAIAAHTGPTLVEMRDLSLSAIFDRLEADWATSAWEKGLRLRFLAPSCLAHSNPGMLLTILSNLIGNAIKHTVKGGVVVGSRRRGHQVAIDVIDTGPGFDEDLRVKMFNAFEKGESAREGHGLGLWLVAQTCQTLGHRIETRSTPGRGSRFRVILPGPSIAYEHGQ